MGTLTLFFSPRGRTPRPSRRDVLTVRIQTGRAIERLRAGRATESRGPEGTEKILRQRTQELLTLETIARALARPQNRTEMLAQAVGALVTVTQADAGTIRLLDERSAVLTLEAVTGLPGGLLENLQPVPLAAIAETRPGMVYRYRVANGPFIQEARALFLAEGFSHMVRVPIFAKDRLLGVLSLYYRTEPSVSAPVLAAVASQLGIALENADLFARTRDQEQDAREMSRSLSAANVQLQDSILKLRQAHDQLLQSEKLSALGQLVSGVAHELNNPLSIVMGYAQLLLADSQDETLRAKVERIHTQAERAARIVRNLLTFARKSGGERRPLSVNEILERTVELRAYHLKVDNVAVTLGLDRGLPTTHGDPQQLQQVFLNLINNAHYAMLTAHGRGQLILRTFRANTRSGHEAIGIEVTDDGPGISPEILPHLFNPFFTTKPVGEGTGLGLAICHGIVEEHGGEIACIPAPGGGGTFRVTLPVLRGSDESFADEAERAWPSPGRRILVIDDEEAVREILQEALAKHGHLAHVTASGREALQWMETVAYDLIICDVKMPDMDGRRFHDEVRSRWPALLDRIVFCTGDIVNPKTQSFLQASGCRYVAKPFKVEELLTLLGPRRSGASPDRPQA